MNQDEALLLVREQDMKTRMNGGQQFIDFLSSPDGDISMWTNVDKIVDALATYWVSSSNYKVALLGLDILSLLVERLQNDFQPHYNLVQNALVDRLGDQKDQVRDASITLLTNIMDAAASPQFLFEKLGPAFTHKVWRVREGVCRLLVATINRFGARSLFLSKLLPHICKLLSDQNGQVRDIATSTIVEIYRHVGDKVRQDLSKKGLPPSKLRALFEMFDGVLQSGDMVVSMETGSLASSTGSFGSVESASSSGLMRPPSTNVVASSNSSRPSSARTTTTDGSVKSAATSSRRSVLPKTFATNPRSNAGAVDEESFVRDFDQNLPPVRIYGVRDVEEQMSRIQSIISNDKKDWEERTKALKALRAVAVAGGTEYDAFYQHLRLMEPALQLNAKDLRSQVVRETCVTIGFLSSCVKNQFEHSSCFLLPTLFSLIPNAAKVMSTSGILSIRTMLKHTHGFRIIPVVTGYCTSRTTSIRRHTFAFLDIMFQHWMTNLLERHISLLKESVQKGINDADAEAREEARKAWHGLYQHFPAEADDVFHTLNPAQQKLIRGSTSAVSVDGLPSNNAPPKKPRTSMSTTGVGPRRAVPRAPPSAGLRTPGSASTRFLRSRSDIDPASAKRSQMKAARSGYGTLGRSNHLNSRFSTSSNISATLQERGRESERPVASQPGSRSNSPGAQRRAYGLSRTPIAPRNTKSSYNAAAELSPTVKSSEFDPVFDFGPQCVPTRTPPSSPTPRRKSRIPVSNSRAGSRAGSRLGSRVGSPTGSRSGSPPRYRGRSSSNISSHGPPPMRVLPKGKEGEQALTDALTRKLNRRVDHYGMSDNDDDLSDTSSVCSDRSASYSNRNGLKRHQNHTEDVVEILQMCQSNLWTDRREGLNNLHILIRKRKEFSRLQLKKVLEIFNRLFADPHGKVFGIFMEILPDFIVNYNDSVHEWLYILLTQLLKKMGADLLGSVQSKVLKALHIARESFPTQLQFNILCRYIIDQTQRPNLKVKVALLHCLLDLVALMEPGEITNTSDTRLALSRIITWTAEPKSQDVRKIAEALVISVFELNAPTFTAMIKVLPKTFQDGAMKVLQGYRKANDSTSSTQSDTSSGQVVGMVALSPGRNVVSPRGNVGSVDIMSPRGSLQYNGNENMNRDEIAENFRDITAGIQKLRMDSCADDVITPKNHPGKENKYNPNSYSEIPPHSLLMEATFDEEDSLHEDSAFERRDNDVADVAFSFTSGKDKRHCLEELSRMLRSSDGMEGLAASQQQNQWDQHFSTVLSALLGVLRGGESDLRLSALQVLKEMLLHLSNRFKNFAEVTVIHILESHKDPSKEVSRAAEDCGNALCSLLPPVLCINVLTPLTRSSDSQSIQACLKMLNNSINRSAPDELTNQLVTDLVPGLLQCYDNTESGIRKAAVFCLVALHRVIGDSRLCQHLTSLSGGKMKLLQLYIKKSQSHNVEGSGDV